MTTLGSQVLLETRGNTKDFSGVRALDNVSFDVRAGEIHSLCGANGAGQSTLLKLLSKFYSKGSYQGEILFEGSAKDVGIVYQELSLVSEMNIAENIFLGREKQRFGFISRHLMYHDTSALLSRLGLDIAPDTKV